MNPIKIFLLAVCSLIPLQVWSQQRESLVIKVHHLPTTSFTILRADLSSETPTATLSNGFSRYNPEDKSWTDIIADSVTHRLVDSQQQELIFRAAGIDTLTPSEGVGIDGNHFTFIHQKGDGVFNYESFSDTRDSLAHYLYRLFDLPGAVTVLGQVGHKVAHQGCLDTSDCWEPLPLTHVSLLSSGGDTLATTLADGQGLFELTVLPTRCSLVVSHPGYVTRAITHIPLSEDVELKRIILPAGDPKHTLSTPYNPLGGITTSGAVIGPEDIIRIPTR